MGILVENTLHYLANSIEAQYQLGISDGNGSSKDSVINMLEDSISRVELEFSGLDSTRFSREEITGKSMDGASAFQIPDVTHYDKMLRFVEYGDIDILKHTQNTSTMPVGAKEQKFLLDDYTGKYKRGTSDSTDIPMVSLTGTDYTIKAEMGHGGVSWSQEDIDTATFSGRPLEIANIRAVRRAYLEDIYNLVISGNDNIKGLIGNVDEFTVIDTVADPNSVAGVLKKYWINKIATEILFDLVKARNTVAIATQSRWGGSTAGIDNGIEGNSSSFTCFVAQSAFVVLTEKLMTDNTGGDRPISVWSYINSQEGKIQTGIDKYVVVHAFDSAFQSATKAGFMILPNSTEAYSFEKPLDLTPKPVQFRDLKMIIPYYDYFAGLKLIRDKALVGFFDIAAAS